MHTSLFTCGYWHVKQHGNQHGLTSSYIILMRELLDMPFSYVHSTTGLCIIFSCALVASISPDTVMQRSWRRHKTCLQEDEGCELPVYGCFPGSFFTQTKRVPHATNLPHSQQIVFCNTKVSFARTSINESNNGITWPSRRQTGVRKRSLQDMFTPPRPRADWEERNFPAGEVEFLCRTRGARRRWDVSHGEEALT